MIEVYLLLGSNEGKREANVKNACGLISLRTGKIVKSSVLYETEAWGIKEQSNFLNQAIMITTTLPPAALLNTLKTIEKEIGRVDTIKWGPRVIDIDILFYGNEIIDLPELKIPHPLLHERRFTLIPLNEIASGFIHPVLKKSVGELFGKCKDNSEVKKWNAD